MAPPIRPPMKAPRANMNSTPSNGSNPPSIRPKATLVMNTTAEPTERSMPALAITKVIPTDMTIMNEAFSSMKFKLAIEPNLGSICMKSIAKATMTAVRPKP